MSAYCRECKLPTETYQPTGSAAGTRRAIRHPETAYVIDGYQCPGSFGPVDTAEILDLDTARTVAWRVGRTDGGPSLNEYLRSKGEL